MSIFDPEHLIPAFAAIFGLVALVRPVVRLWVQHRRFGVVTHRARSLPERITSWGFYAMALGIAALAVLIPWKGPAALGLLTAPLPARVAGAALMAAGILVMVTAQNQMGASWRIGIAHENTDMVYQGLYGHIRHPIYTGLILGATGGLLVVPGAITALGWLGVIAGVSLQARLEEAHQQSVHGESYRTYGARTGRFLPGVGRL